jgi:hypothetical protein
MVCVSKIATELKKAIISDGFFAESRSYGTPYQPPKLAEVESTTEVSEGGINGEIKRPSD